MGEFDLDDSKFDEIRGKYKEHLSMRRNRFVEIKNSAIRLLGDCDKIFSPDVLMKLPQVKDTLSQRIEE